MPRQPESGSLLADVELEPLPEYGPFSRRQSTIPRKPVPSNVSSHALLSQDTSKYAGGSMSDISRDISRDIPLGHQYGGNAWLPGFWRQFPFRGAFAILGCISCIIASIVVLVVSDGEPTDYWRISPTVYLAFFMTGTNMLARFAFHDGIKISWWYKALQGGTIRDLHVQWSHADGFWTALFSGRDFNLVTLASIAVTIMVIDQPLIQRASSVVSVPRTRPVSVIAPIAPEIPWGFTGYNSGRGNLAQVMTQPVIAAFNEFNSNNAIASGFLGCTNTCTGWVEAGGLAASCNTTTGPILYQSLSSKTVFIVSPFSVQFDLIGPSGPPANASSRIIMSVAYTQNSTGDGYCTGIRTEITCSLAPATIRYPIKLTGGNLEINDDILTNGQIVAFSPPPPLSLSDIDRGGDYSRWTLGGIYIAAQSLFASNATYRLNDAIQFPTLPDTLSQQFLQLPTQNLTEITSVFNLTAPQVCASNWSDPTSYILSSLNNIVLRTSIKAATFPFRNTTALPVPQNLTMLQTSNINVFKSEYRYLIASTVLTTVFIFLIAPMFIGWWELGRSVTLNPLETAKAFDAPLLSGPGSNAPLADLIKIAGAKNVRLGEMETYVDGQIMRRQLKMAYPVEVTVPRDGKVYE